MSDSGASDTPKPMSPAAVALALANAAFDARAYAQMAEDANDAIADTSKMWAEVAAAEERYFDAVQALAPAAPIDQEEE